MSVLQRGLRLDSLIPDGSNAPTGGYAASDTEPYLDFDSDTAQYVYASIRLSDEYNSGARLEFDWSGITSISAGDTARWGCDVMRMRAGADGNPDTENYDTANTVDSDISASVGGDRQRVVLTLTNFASAAAGDFIRLRIYRDSAHANDDLAENARLWGLTFMGDTA